jgi:regulator of protease activity HflC (stomatin/prohibitin superfamily)
MPDSADTFRARGLSVTFAVVFTIALAIALTVVQRTGLKIFAALAGLSGWGAVVAVGNLIPLLRWNLRTAIRVLLTLGVVAIPLWFQFVPRAVSTGATTTFLQLATVVVAVLAFGLYFLATYGSQVERETPAPITRTLVPMARLVAAAHAMLVLALLVRLYAGRTWFHPLEVAFNLATVVLIGETFLHAVARLYQPTRLRLMDGIFGHSVVLPALFGESGPLRSLAATLEKTFGVRLRDTWIVQLGRILVGPLLLLGIVGLWASTAVTRVPIDSRGVLVQRGAFAREALPPGLHFHLPWPWSRVELVPTERVQEISLGFERDLAGPVLWAEKHFEGEQNLLVGQGEELLTINVPIHFRVRDAVAYLRRASDARAALESLGYRELLGLTTAHTAFGLMTTDRAEITGKLRSNLQAAVDRLELGIEIVFVGLKDVHPPVPVAPAYQDVVSAEEQRAALVDHARTYAVQAGIAATVSAAQLRLQANTSATERRARATGEVARFLATLPVYRQNPDVYTTRRRLEATEAALSEIRQLVLVPREARGRANFYLGLDAATPVAPAALR